MSEPNVPTPPPPDPFNAGLVRMGHAVRRAHRAFDDADEAFEETMRALIVLTETRGTFQTRIDGLEQHVRDQHETITELKQLVLEQGQQIRGLRHDVHALRERLNGDAH